MKAVSDFAKLYQEARALEVDYSPVCFPMRHRAGGFFSMKVPGGNGEFTFALSGPGATYILHSLGAYPKRHQFPNWKKNQGAFAEAVSNWAAEAAPYEVFNAVTVGGELYGLPKNYNIVSHETVLEWIEDMGLASKVRWASISAYEMALFVSSSYKGNGGPSYEYGILVTNGMTGHVALKFSSYIKVGGEYIREFKDAHTSKHLSNVGEWGLAFSGLSQECLATEVDTALQVISAAEAMKVLSRFKPKGKDGAKWDAIKKKVGGKEHSSALDILLSLGDEVKYGQKPLVRASMDHLIDGVMGLFKQVA